MVSEQFGLENLFLNDGFLNLFNGFFFFFYFSDDSLGYEFPFILRAISEGGRLCALCPWSKFCRGCEIPCNDYPLLQGMISVNSEYLLIDHLILVNIFD